MALEKKTMHNRLTIKDLEKRINELEARLILLEPRKSVEGKSLNKVETYNGESEPQKRESSGMRMDEKAKLESISNALVILPPNLKVDGRHLSKNVSAICGFKVTEEMLDAVYSK